MSIDCGVPELSNNASGLMQFFVANSFRNATLSLVGISNSIIIVAKRLTNFSASLSCLKYFVETLVMPPLRSIDSTLCNTLVSSTRITLSATCCCKSETSLSS